jgi:hypothetical protein
MSISTTFSAEVPFSEAPDKPQLPSVLHYFEGAATHFYAGSRGWTLSDGVAPRSPELSASFISAFVRPALFLAAP